MATTTNGAAISRWVHNEVCPNDTWPYLRHPWIFGRRGLLVSADGAFTLAETIYESRSNEIRCFLLNGDLGRNRNSGHQWEVRRCIQREGVPHLIVPFSALEAASIDRATIRPIEIREDKWEDIIHEVQPYDTNDIQWSYRWGTYQDGKIKGRPTLRFSRDADGPRSLTAHDGWRPITQRRDGTLFSTERRHVLGDSVFKAKVNDRYRTFVSSFDYQERRPLYFLAEVPAKSLVKTVDDAILALAPPIVHAAIAQGRDVKRQGDMFAIPTELTTREVKIRTGARIEKRKGVLGTDHIATESIEGKGRITYARGFLHHRPEMRRSDHDSVNLGKDWHLMVPNAVPRRVRGLQVRV